MRAIAEKPRPYGRRVPLPETHAVREHSRAALVCRVERKALLIAADQAGRALRLPCSARTVLSVLAACYGEQQLSQGLLVWPSNAYLADKTGLPERTLRAAILRLRQEALLLAVDSPNGKRYARRRGNSVTVAYGFDLAPLYSRREALAATVAAIDAERKMVRALRTDLNAVYKDLEDLIVALCEQGRIDLAQPFMDDLSDYRPARRRLSSVELAELLTRAELARRQAERCYYLASKAEVSAATGGRNCRHIESNTEFSAESCQYRSDANAPHPSNLGAASGGSIWASEKRRAEGVRFTEHDGAAEKVVQREDATPLSLSTLEALADVDLWRRACPALEEFFGPVRSMGDVQRAGARSVRLLQVAPHGVERWQRQLGPLFPLVAAYVFQLYSDDQLKTCPEIRKTGGFFWYVAREVAEGVRDLPLELMALQRKKLRRRSAAHQADAPAEFPRR